MNLLAHLDGDWAGNCGFRMLPTDDLASAASSAGSDAEANGFGWSLHYQWTHPDDGVQSGTLLVASDEAGDAVNAAWIDSWHQKPLGVLTGKVIDGGVRVEMDYAGGWGWVIEVAGHDDQLRMRMSNVVPDGVEGAEPGPYVVMDAQWERVTRPA